MIPHRPNEVSKEAAPRRLALAFLLALLAVLIAAVTANAYVTKKTRTTLADFDSGTFLLTGLLTIPPDIESVQLMPIGLTGDWHGTTPLPRPLYDMGTTSSRNFIYILGGTDNNNNKRAEVYSAQISVVPGITEWVQQPSLPAPRTGAAAAIYPIEGTNTSVIYAIGGAGANDYSTNTIYRAIANDLTGEVGSWTLDSQTLPTALHYAGAVRQGDYLYVVGGLHYTNPPFQYWASDQVYYAAINPTTGALGPFQTAPSLPQPVYRNMAVGYEGETDVLYSIGGYDNITSTYLVFFSTVSGGAPASWTQSAGDLPIHLYGHGGVQLTGQIYVTGGIANSVVPGQGISDTVKAALVDPDNPSFMLYDWCKGVPPPLCTIGAWQTGGLLPEVRAFHGTAAGHGYFYVIGGMDANLDESAAVYYGEINGAGALYAPEGWYRSYEIDTDQPASIRRLSWGATMGYPVSMTLSMQYRYRSATGEWSEWSAPVQSISGTNQIDISPPPAGMHYFQYQADLTTVVSTASPLLDWVEVYYEVPDPEVGVWKDTGEVSGIRPGGYLSYTIYYTNFGGWVAESVVLTETLPENTIYTTTCPTAWQQVGSSNLYTHLVGDLDRGEDGISYFCVEVVEQDQLTPGATTITNVVQINYPPMLDEFNQTITDPFLDNNTYQFTNTLLLYELDIAKSAVPPAGSVVDPGDLITYTIHYTNVGLVEASHAIITDTFDPMNNCAIISITPPPTAPPSTSGEYVWDLGALAPAQHGQIQMVVQVHDAAPSNWPITNHAIMASPEGDPALTDVLTHTTSVRPGVDLTVLDMSWWRDPPPPSSLVEFWVTIANQGDADAPDYFGVEIYIKEGENATPPEGPWDHDQGYCLNNCTILRPNYVHLIAYLNQGDATTVHYSGNDLTFTDRTTYTVCAQVDMAFDAPEFDYWWGRYPEKDETNNVWCETVVANGMWQTYLPIINKRYP
ncbi:MAG: hypothetical protein JXM73_03740 [Anaerolineae bacterium]|nr:hypothetical protein [Anaerolineae bacterium]